MTRTLFLKLTTMFSKAWSASCVKVSQGLLIVWPFPQSLLFRSFRLCVSCADTLFRKAMVLRDVKAMTSASMAWCRWSIRFLLKPFCSSRGIVVWKTSLPSLFSQCPKSLDPVSWFIRWKRGDTKVFHTSFSPQSFFSLSVIPPVHGITFLDMTSTSFSSRTRFERISVTSLLM